MARRADGSLDVKILSVEQWMVCPIGTIYAEWTPSTIVSEWRVKGSTGVQDILLHDASLLDYETDDFDVTPDGKKLPSDDFCWSRSTGCYYGKNRFGEEHRFLVLEWDDLESIKSRIDLCISAQNGDTQKISCP